MSILELLTPEYPTPKVGKPSGAITDPLLNLIQV
jgi:hypothetical protein